MYIVLDVEATDESEIIEIGAVKLNDQLEVVDQFQSFVKPTQNSSLTYYIKKLTGIQQAEVDNAEHFPQVFSAFEEWGGENPYFITWSNSDKLYFRREFLLHNIENDFLRGFIDIQNVVCDFISADSVVKLKKALTYFELDFDGDEHRALNDAISTAKLFGIAMNRTQGISDIQQRETLHKRAGKISPQVVSTIPEVAISHHRYRNFLKSLTLPQLEEKRGALLPLVKEAENTITPSYLVQVSWEKYKLLCELLRLRKKEEVLSKQGLTFSQMNALLKCSNTMYALRNNMFTKENEAAKEEYLLFKNKIETNYKHVSRLYKLENLKVTKESVIQSFEWMEDFIDKVTSSPYFKEKYQDQLNAIIIKLSHELEAIHS